MLLNPQVFIMEADYDKFVINEDYLRAVPRASDAEIKALDMKLIQRGQLVPIIVNSKMVVLDGHTRLELLGQRGVKIKYTVMDFETPEDELNFVRETNVMRRHLNHFQRVETMYEQLKHERELKRINSGKSYTDIILSIKDGNNTVIKIAKDLEVGNQYINRMTKTMTEEYYLSRREIMLKTSRNTVKQYIYSLMPKAEERLYKEKEAKKIGRINITDLIGVNTATITKAMHLIENADEVMLDKLRRGVIGISTAHEDLTRIRNHGKPTQGSWWRNSDNIECPHCKKIAKKSEYKKV